MLNEEVVKKLKNVPSNTNSEIGKVNTNIETAKTELNTKIGNTILLNTTDKTNLVNSVNELVDKQNDIENLEEIDNIKCNTDKGEYTIENSKKGYLTNFHIEGKTLVNLANPNNITITEGLRYLNPFRYIEKGKQYTFINLSNKEIYYFHNNVIKFKMNPNSKTLYTIDIDITDANCLCVAHSIKGWGETDADKQEFTKSVMILEGDYTSENISYFERLQSVGQGDNTELLTFKNSENNLFDKNGNFRDNYILQYVNGEELISETSNHKYTLDYIEIEADTGYTFYNCSRNICWYDINKSFIPASLNERIIGDKDIFYIARSPKNAKYLRVTIIKDLHDNGNKTIITKGNKYDKKTILYTLRSLPNGVKDEIVYKNNKYYLIKRCEEHTYNDIGNLNLSHVYDNTLQFMGTLTPRAVVDSLDTAYVLCNNLNGKSRNDFNNNDTEGCSTTGSGDIAFKILKSKLTTQDGNGFSEWIKNNLVTIIYQLAKPQEIELTSLNLEQYNNQTKFICNTGIVIPDVSFESTQNLGSHIEVIRNNIKNYNVRTDFPFSINFLNGWQPYLGYASSVGNYCTNNNFVTINATINGGVTTAGTIIGKIPSKYAPRKGIIVIFRTTDGKYYNGIIRTNGEIEIYYNDITYRSWLYLYVNYLI
ncbi:TPA: hypothetical protein PC436_001432 [Clostridioides difficile]|nr:hypothetical protein [Clostridioides difficile]